MMWLINLIPDFVIQLLVLLSISAIVLQNFVGATLPQTVRILIQFSCILVLCFGMYLIGYRHNDELRRQEIKLMEQELLRLNQESEKTTKVIETKYIDRIKIVKEVGDVILQKIPEYISEGSDGRCVVPVGFVVLHDSAAKGSIPETAKESNETPSGVALSTVSETVVENYNSCRQNIEQLSALQEWVSSQERIYNGN